jgi:hypothetical protein
VISCQFAIHYLFETDATLARLVHNLGHMCKPGGVLIGTCFDGDKLKAELDASPSGVISGTSHGLLVWSIAKRYDGRYDGGTGRAVDVYVETINRPMREYLVSPKRLGRVLGAAGFTLVDQTRFARILDASGAGHGMSKAERSLSLRYISFTYVRAENGGANDIHGGGDARDEQHGV